MTQELRGGWIMSDYYVSIVQFFSIVVIIICVFAVFLKVMRTPNSQPKDYILHSITADGTAFYLHMNEEEYGKWISENHIKIKKLKLQQ